MAQKFIVPITIKQLASAGSDALTIFVDQEPTGRVKIDAGGKISWGNGSENYDANLFRAASGAIATEGYFSASGGIQTAAVSSSPTVSLPNGALIVDNGSNSLYFRANNQWVATNSNVSLSLNDLSDVVTASVTVGDALKWDGTNWINGPVSVIATLNDLTDVSTTSLDDGQILRYSSSSASWYNDYENSYFDGGTANSEYGGGLLVVTGGGASG